MISTIIEDKVQRDGRRDIVEQHIDDDGISQLVYYVAEPGEDVEAHLAARVSILEEQAKATEVAKSVESLEEPVNAPRGDFVAEAAKLYLAASGLEVARLASYLISLNAEEIAQYKLDAEKLQAEAALYEQVINLRGE